MDLRFLDFDYSENEDGHACFEAMASALPDQQAALQAEVAGVLAWAHREFPAGPGPLDDGADWDMDLHGSEEASTSLALDFDAASQRLQWRPQGTPLRRQTFTVTLTGTPAFADALRWAFGIG